MRDAKLCLAARRLKTQRRRDGAFRCEVCDWEPPRLVREQAMHAHHVIPIAKGGADHEGNLVLLCPNCHQIVHSLAPRFRPHATTPTDFVRMLQLLFKDEAAYVGEAEARRTAESRVDDLTRWYRQAVLTTDEQIRRKVTGLATATRGASYIGLDRR